MKHYYSLIACAESILWLSNRAQKARSAPTVRVSELQLHVERAQQIVDTFNDPRERAAIEAALAALREGKS